MKMDPSFSNYSDFTNGFIPNSNVYSVLSDHSNGDFMPSSINLFSLTEPSFPSTTLSPGEEIDSNDEDEFSIYVLKFINQILMEENKEEEETSMYNDPLGLLTTEKSFYDALGESYPYSANHSLQNPDTNFSVTSTDYASFQFDSDSISQFQRGFEEASKFLPKGNQLISPYLNKKNNHEREEGEEERTNKHSAHYIDESELSEMFDRVLLQVDPRCGQSEPSKVKAKPSSRRGRGKRQNKKKEIVDLRNLLISCAQAVSSDDTRTAYKILKQIRQHCSPNGDGSQRLAHFFANGLDARLAGMGAGGNGYSPLLAKVKASDLLKAFHLNLSSSPFRKMAMFFANKSINQVAEKATTLHIVDFGILYGFQWPIFIQHLSKRDGGPPNLRITGIEFPQSGFRPKERVEETGRRLAKYCERFGVPFRYNAIATKNWESISVEEIEIENNEVVAVNCMMRLKHIEETAENCPRNAVLSLIRKMNPAIFVNSIVNGSYNAPFFVTRFREALFHYSALFDMLDTTIARENQVRLLYESEIFGREIVNVIACEGEKRLERPETYRQWHARCLRTGFRALPLDQEMMRKFKEKLRKWYHKDFVIDEDSNWMLQGWKGRIVYASSCWVPA